MAKTRSNKRPTKSSNATTVVDVKASLANTTTTTIPPTNTLATVVNTRTRSKKPKDGFSDEKTINEINNKKISKINLSAKENTHNTRRRSLNNKNIKNAAGEEMDTSNIDSSPESDNNDIDSAESLSDTEQEVIKVIEIVDESESYNLNEDDDDDEGKEYELMYVEDGEEGDGEIEYLNEEYLLDDDFILQNNQNDDNLQNTIIIEDDDELITDSVVETEIDSNVENIQSGIVIDGPPVKLYPVVPMATRSRRSHVNVRENSPDRSKLTKRKVKESDKNIEGEIIEANKVPVDDSYAKSEPETSIIETITVKSELQKIEEIPKKVFVPNIEPPATRARCRKSISIPDSGVKIDSKEETPKNYSFEFKNSKHDRTPKSEENTLENTITKSTLEIPNEKIIQETCSNESKPESIEEIAKTRINKRLKLLTATNMYESNKTVLIGNNENTIPATLTEPKLDKPVESTKQTNQEKSRSNEDVSSKLQNSEKDVASKTNNIFLDTTENEKIYTAPVTITTNPQPSPMKIRTTRYSKTRILKPDVESTEVKSDTVTESKVSTKMFSSDTKNEENEPPPEIQVKSINSPKIIENISLVVPYEVKQESVSERIVEVQKNNKSTIPSTLDIKDKNNTKVLTEEKKIDHSVPKPAPKIERMEVDIVKNSPQIIQNQTDVEQSPGLKKPGRKSIKDVPQINEASSSQKIMTSKLVPEIVDITTDSDTENTISNLNIEVPSSSEHVDDNIELKNSQEAKSTTNVTPSRSQLAYTSIISTRRQKKEQVKPETLKPLEKISKNCMAIVEKLLQESSLNNKNISSTLTEVTQSKMEITKLKPELNPPPLLEFKKIEECDKMEVDEIKLPAEEKPPSVEVKFKEPLAYCIEEKLKNIKLDQIKNDSKPEFPPPHPKPIEPDSTKIKEFETKINRNFYAEAFAGLSHETRTHIFEALLRSKTDPKVVSNKEAAVKEDSVEFDDQKNIFVKKKSNKKIKKSSKKERKLGKIETPTDDSKLEDDESLRRSSRIKTISQTRQRSHGHGLVKARDRLHDMDDGIDEENSSLNKYKALEIDAVERKDYKPSKENEAEVNREREMIRRLKQFTTIKENIYHCDKNISKEAKKMTCDCFLTKEEIERGELGCGEDCLNRLLMIECGPKCVVAERCTNRKFQKTQYANCKVFQTEKKGFGIMAGAIILPGEFIMEYVGEVLNSEQFEKRADDYSKDKNMHYYFMALRSDAVIDATSKGNVSRFINHSCDPNAETQKWTVNGELRIGFFSTRVILKGEEITFDYQFQRYGKEAQKCYCEASNCRGWIGEEPDSADEDDDEEEEEEDDGEEMPHVEKLEATPTILPIPVPITEIDEIIREEILTTIVEPTVDVPKEITEVPVTIPALVSELANILPIAPLGKIKKPTKKERKAVKTRKTRSELLEDADLEEEVNILNRTGLKNQAHTLKLSRLMVRAKLMNARIRLLQLLQNGEMPCRRLFLDYHGLRLLHGWMSDSATATENLDNLKFKLKLLDTLKALPIPNKTLLKDSKVINLVQKWSVDDKKPHYSPNDDTPSDSGSGTPIQQIDSPNNIASSQSSTIVASQSSVSSTVEDELSYVNKNIIKVSLKLIENWESLPEVFRIPKKERIEQMKEHEREADLRYKSLGLSDDTKEINERCLEKKQGKLKFRDKIVPYSNNGNNASNKLSNSNVSHLDKYQRRQMFEMKFAKEQEEKKKQEYWRLHEMTCTCFRLDPRKTIQEDVPAIVNPATGQWYTKEMKPVATPPSHAHIKPPEQVLSTIPDDYELPKIDLPTHWKFAIDTKGRIYYYHVKIRIPQWEPPIFLPPLAVADEIKQKVESKEKNANADKESSSTDTTDSSEDELKERVNNLKQRFKERGQPLPEINITDSELVESLDAEAKNKDNISDTFPRIDPVKSSYKINKRKRRREGLVQERIISPRTEEDKMYGQQQSRMYRETKEKLRRRKEEMRKRRLVESGSQSMRNNKIIKLTDGLPVSISPYDSDESDDESELSYRRNNDSTTQNDPDNAVDFVESLISHNMSDNDARLLDGLKEIGKEKVNKKNVYEEWKKQQAKLKSDARKRELNQSKLIQSTSASSSTSSSSSTSHVKRRKVILDNIDLSSDEIRRIKEKFRTDIAGVIVQHLGPYRKDSCKIGRIEHDEDFKHLARKLTHFVMLKELKHCDNTVNALVVTDSVKTKSREFIKKYMAKYGAAYRRGENEPDYKD